MLSIVEAHANFVAAAKKTMPGPQFDAMAAQHASMVCTEVRALGVGGLEDAAAASNALPSTPFTKECQENISRLFIAPCFCLFLLFAFFSSAPVFI